MATSTWVNFGSDNGLIVAWRHEAIIWTNNFLDQMENCEQ